jgi:uncharacterized protein (TIGR02271 family)
MKTQSISGRLIFAATSLVGLALVGGCCTHSSQGAAESAQESQASTASTSESSQNAVIPLYKESVSVGTRQVDAGTVTVKKVVKTETVNQPVELRHEEIVLERQPASSEGNQDMSQAFQEKETTIHLMKDEPVISKQTVPAGQVIVKKNSQSEQQNIQTQVRSEDVIQENAGGAESPSGQSSGKSDSQ